MLLYTLHSKVRELLEGRGCKWLYLPPYSSFLNPIEDFWTKVKASVKRNAWTSDDRLSDRIVNSSRWLLELTVKLRFAMPYHYLQDVSKKKSICEKIEQSAVDAGYIEIDLEKVCSWYE